MSKPDWDSAPEWAMYLAMDGNGGWYWYLDKPVWNQQRGRWIYGERSSLAAGHSQIPSETLERRP